MPTRSTQNRNFRIRQFLFFISLPIFAIAVFVNCLETDCRGQERKSEQTDSQKKRTLPSAQTLIDKHIAALGGRTKLAKAKTLIEKGDIRYVRKDKEGIIERYYAPNRYYVKIDLKDYGVLEQGYDGKVAWRNLRGSYFLLKDSEARNFKITAKRVFNVLDMTMAFDGTFETVKEVDINEKPAYQVLFKPNDGLPYSKFFDKKSNLIVKTKATQLSFGQTLEIGREILDVRKVDGYKMSFRQKTTSNGQDSYDIKVKSIEFNKPIDKKIFDLPAQIQKLVDAKEGKRTEDF